MTDASMLRDMARLRKALEKRMAKRPSHTVDHGPLFGTPEAAE